MTRRVRSARAEGDGLEVAWQGGGYSRFPLFWLRDHCGCAACLHPETLQRQVDTFALPEDLEAAAVALEDDGETIAIRWTPEGHDSRFSTAFLESMTPQAVPSVPRRQLWEAAAIAAVLPRVDCVAVMADDLSGVLPWLEAVELHGFCLVEGVPATPEATRALAERIAYIRETIFGGFWDFTADLAHGDTAYTTLPLGPHTDGTYSLDAPGLQMFHCLHFEGEGGESILVDGFHAAESLRRDDPRAFRTLARVRVPGRYLEPGVELRAERPLLRLDESGAVSQVSFNNYDRAPFLLAEPWMSEFYRALRRFHALLARPEAQLTVALRPGTVLLFDNWRVLHGRAAYRGERRLAGCYLNREDFESRLRVLRARRDGSPEEPSR